jgi:hypothetical protein
MQLPLGKHYGLAHMALPEMRSSIRVDDSDTPRSDIQAFLPNHQSLKRKGKRLQSPSPERVEAASQQ